MKILTLILSFLVLIQCQQKEKSKNSIVPTESVDEPELTKTQLEKLVELPLHCSNQEFPNKPSNVLASLSDAQPPAVMHPAFYGCFDWHSAVHGHWMMVKAIDSFPNLEQSDSIILTLEKNLTQENIEAEITYFSKDYNYSFERTYGWAWLLKLQQVLNNSKTPELKALAPTLEPLTQLLVNRWKDFLPKLLYPIRVGTHSNTAFGLSLAWDYARSTKDSEFQDLISKEAKRMFMEDQNCPIDWEPNGTDFLSPCLQESDLMRKILPEDEFLHWLNKFLPQLANKDFDWAVALVSDRADGHLVHLDGLNFSRAWCFYALAKQYPEKYGHLENLADKHMDYSLPNLVGDSYEGSHWLATFAMYAFEQQADN